jgi:N-acetylmuramoyl-L-alanine amidase
VECLAPGPAQFAPVIVMKTPFERNTEPRMARPARFWRAGVLSALLLGGLSAGRAESDWHIVKVLGRDYLTLQNVAQFYQLQPRLDVADHEIVFADDHASLELGSDPRAIEINGVKQYLSFPVIQQNGQALISRFDLAKTIEPCLRPTMIANLPPFHTVVLDAGHGGVDRGAGSMLGGAEKDYTLDVIRDIRASLEARGFKVVTTRDSDVYVPLEARAAEANEIPDSIFVSVHFNSSPTGGAANGFEVFAMSPQGAASTGDAAVSLEQFERLPGNEDDNASLALATCVHHSLLGHIPEADRGVKRARFAVLRLTHSPAILVEGGFLTNPADSQEIADAAWRQKLALAVAQGVQSYQDLANRRVPPKLLADYRAEQLPVNGTIVNPAALAANVPKALVPVQPVSNPGAAPLASPAPGAATPEK